MTIKTMLITNDEAIIEQNKNFTHIEHSLYMGKVLFDKYDYIIIDYDTFLIEEYFLEEIKEYKDKILILGDGYIDNIRSLSKDEFHIDNIDLYYGNNIPLENLYIVNADIDTNLEIDRIINLYTKEDLFLGEVVESLTKASQAVKQSAYQAISIIDNGAKLKKLKWSNPIRLEYSLRKIINFKIRKD